jgi:hypothetical protein
MMASEDVAAATAVNQDLEVVDPGEPGVGLALLDNVADSETLKVVEDMKDLALAIRLLQRVDRTVVVAAAGNDATGRPTYPAVLPGVVGIGAVDREGRPAPFSNYGPWVRASSLGVTW